MRELKRSIAKVNMREAGFDRLFKRPRVSTELNPNRKSLFARKWREFVAIKKKRKKSLAKAKGVRDLMAGRI